MKRLFMAGLIGVIAMIGASISGPAVAAEIVLKAGHGQNAGEPFDLGLKMIAEEVEKATNGNATIKIFPSMQLGGEVEMIKQVMTGTLDITAPSNAPLTNFVPELKIFDMPFLFRDEAHMIKVLRGPVLQEMNKIVKIRTMQSKYHMAAFNAFGANATPISYAELYSSLQTGVVDGAEAANTNYFEKKFYEVAPYWAQVGWTILTAPVIMSEKKFQSLPKNIQDALLRGGAKAAAWEQDYYTNVDKGRLDDVRKAGVTITKLDPAPFREAAKKVYAEFLETDDERRILRLIQETK